MNHDDTTSTDELRPVSALIDDIDLALFALARDADHLHRLIETAVRLRGADGRGT